MRMRNPKDKDEVLNGCDYYYEGSFDNNNPVCLEIGMGKGQFILNMALNNPNVNYIGVEKYSSVASVAIKKINEYKPSNLKVLIGVLKICWIRRLIQYILIFLIHGLKIDMLKEDLHQSIIYKFMINYLKVNLI